MTSTSAVLKVLFDSNVLKNAVTHRAVLKPRTIKWGPTERRVEVAEDVPNCYRGSSEEQTAWKFQYLSRIAQLAEARRIECNLSREIQFENWALPRPVPMLTDNAFLFGGIEFRDAALPMERVVGFRAFEQKDQFRMQKEAYFASINHPRFLALNAATGTKHAADTYHLWTAESNQLDVFLTMDKKFQRVFAKQQKVRSTVQIMLPWQLVSSLL
jgi:hypothetical protein